jgi:hypothetical protein
MAQMQKAKEPKKRSILPTPEHFRAIEQRRRWGIFSISIMPLKMPQMQGATKPEKRSVLPVREHFRAIEQRRRWGIFSGIKGNQAACFQ